MKLSVENVTRLVYRRNTEGLTFRARKAPRQRKDLHSKRHTSLASISAPTFWTLIYTLPTQLTTFL